MKGFKINALLTFISIIAITSVQAATYEARYKLEELKDAVNEEAPLPSIANITFNPNIINEGESTSASWNVEGASYYYINGNNAPTSKITNNNIGIKPNAVGNLSYELEAYNFQNKSTTGFGLLEVVAKPKLISFTVDKDTVYEGQSVIFSWTGADVFNYKLNTQDVSGNTISLLQSKVGKSTYTLYAYNKLGYEVAMEKEINVLSDPLPTSISLSVDKPSVTESESVNLSWAGKDVVKYTLQGNGISNPNVSGSSISVVPILGNNEYVLNGYNNKNESVTDRKSVQVIAKPIINTLTSDKTDITVGDPVILNWNLSNSTLSKINDVDVSSITTKTYTPSTTTVYTLDAYNANQYKVSKTVNVNVVNKSEITSFTASKNTVYQNESVTLSWVATGAQSFTLNGEAVTGNSKVIAVDKSTEYTLEASNSLGNKTTKQLSIEVAGEPEIVAFTADKDTIAAGDSTTLRLNTSLSVKNEINGSIVSGNNLTITPATTTKYTLISTNKIGRTTSKELTVTVVPNSTISSFTVDGNTSVTVYPAKTLNFSWSSNGTAKTINSTNVTGTSTSIAAPTSAGTYNYILTVENSVGVKQTATVSVIVVPDPQIVSFTADSYSIGPNQSTTLRLNTGYSNSNLINGVAPAGGNYSTVSPTVTTIYTLVAKNGIGRTVSQSLTITVSPETWTDTTPVYTNWVTTNALYNCVNWTPNPSTVTTNTTFTQTATCSTDQTRNRQNREIGTYTGVVRDKGVPIAETTTISQTASRSYGVTLSGWSGNTVSSCATWTPDPSTVNSGTQFTQTGSTCSLPQTRTRTENYIDHKTGANIQVSVVPQNQTLTVNGTGYINGTRVATGTKPTGPDCRYVKNQYYIQDLSSMGSDVFAVWNGNLRDFYDLNYSDPTYVYSKGTAQPSSEGVLIFQICRRPK